MVFSSSASIYDVVPGFVVDEQAPLAPTSPARTKYMMEMILRDFCASYGMRGIALRYFNPIGADPQMRSGIHVAEPTHVLGKLVDVALGKLPFFQLTGTHWPTRDGSGLRDYIPHLGLSGGAPGGGAPSTLLSKAPVTRPTTTW